MNLVVYLKPFKRLLSAALNRSVCLKKTAVCNLLHYRTTSCNCERPTGVRQPIAAFSLVEMLMALLVASLLLAALAPVMTKKMNDSLTINSNFNIKDKETITYEITSDKPEYCGDTIQTDEEGNEYYECHFTVPSDYNGPMNITLISAGGGGGTAPTAGYTEYTQTGVFTVPAMVNKIEATLISGGAGGGAGGQILKSQTFVASGTGNVKQDEDNKLTVLSSGTGTWSVPEIARGKNVLVTACGGGGGGGGSPGSGHTCGQENSQHFSGTVSGYGGGGGYISNVAVLLNNAASQNVIIGGYGGGGGAGGGMGGAAAAMGINGRFGGGGGGGGDQWCTASGAGGGGGSTGGNGGDLRACSIVLGLGGQRGDISLSTNTNGADAVLGSATKGGTGTSTVVSATSSTGGDSVWGNPKEAYTHGGGGGGGSTTGYGGGGGGAGSSTGGGGGGGGATILGTRNNILAIAPGGGGGGGGATDDYNYATHAWMSEANLKWGGGGGGGGGGGTGGGTGGTGARSRASFNPHGNNGAGYSASTIFGGNYCNGGSALAAGNHTCPQKGGNGQDGAMRISYLSYGPGGSGGGAAQMVPIQPVSNIKPGDTLNIKIGNGQAGGTAGRIENNGTVTLPTIGKGEDPAGSLYDDYVTEIYKGSETLLSTATIIKHVGNDLRFGYGLYGGSTTGESFAWSQKPYYACEGYMTDGLSRTYRNNEYAKLGFSNTQGYNANDPDGTKTIFLGSKIYPNGSTGGAGGRIVTPWPTVTCTPGKGGTAPSPKGGDATGFGCGGGGGYGLSDGGRGANGYARISWNMYWDAALGQGGDYKRPEIGAGGGGASGNVMNFSIANAIGGQTFTIRIGKGGKGAYVVDNSVIPAKRGGATVFELGISDKIKVAGGLGGSSVITNGDDIVNGNGGSVPSNRICYYNSSDYTKKAKYCTKGKEGLSTDNANGGKGGSIANYGEGGSGGMQDTGDRSKGGAGSGIASGGGGAAIRIITGSITVGDILNNPNEGGSGANGKVIIQMLRSASGN